MQTLQGYIFCIFQHLQAKLCNFTNFKMLFQAVVIGLFFHNKIKHIFIASNGKRSLVPETSDDILKMESKFSKQSKDKIINEQEKILKQIKNQQLPEKKALEEIKFNKGGMPHDEVRSNENKSKSHVSRATIEVNKCTKGIIEGYIGYITELLSFMLISCLTSTIDTTSPTTTFQAGHQNLELGSLVEVTVNQKSRYGVIRWIGCPPNSRIKMAGLELVSACGTVTSKPLNNEPTIAPKVHFFIVYLCLTVDHDFSLSLKFRKKIWMAVAMGLFRVYVTLPVQPNVAV